MSEAEASGPGPAVHTNTSPAHWGIEGLALGISLGGTSRHDEWLRQLDWVERADALGLHSVWIPEMHFAPGGATSPLLTLAACAARSKKLRLGTTSLLLPIHPPLRIADDVATLDALSDGRVLLGLGRGFRAPLFAAFGIDPTSKRDRFDAALDLILDRWAGRPTKLAGTPFESQGGAEPSVAGMGPRPVQSPHPPLAVAAFGRKGLLQAARRGLPYLASPLEPLSIIEENLQFHREHMPAIGDAAAPVVPMLRTVYAAASDAESDRVRDALEVETRRMTAMRGRVPASIARAAAADLDERAIIGTVSQVQDLLGRYRERAGLDLLIARPQVGATSQAEREAALERLAGEVLPAIA